MQAEGTQQVLWRGTLEVIHKDDEYFVVYKGTGCQVLDPVDKLSYALPTWSSAYEYMRWIEEREVQFFKRHYPSKVKDIGDAVF